VNILISGHDTFHNKGCQALVFTTTEIMKQAFPKARFSVFSWEPAYDKAHFDNTDIECSFVQHRFQTNEFSKRNRFWLAMNHIGLKTDRILWVKPSFYEAIKSCDLMVVSGGDILADYGEAAVKHYFFPIAIAKALRKPVYVFAQSISPYKSQYLLRFAKQYLDNVDLITVREELSFDYLRSISIKSPFYLTADPAFLLRPSSQERLSGLLKREGIMENSALTIGISVSETVTKWGYGDRDTFLKLMSLVCDTMVEHYNARLIFVPHVTYSDSDNNDQKTSASICQLIKKKESVYILNDDYSCRDLKAVIGMCDIFIGARTHATIASSSQSVPTLALAYSIKAFGIMEDVLDREQCTCDIKTLTADELLEKVGYLIENRYQIRQSMSKRLEAVKERSRLNGKLAQEFFGPGSQSTSGINTSALSTDQSGKLIHQTKPAQRT
jgi:colanic acid/amylovoran biosynthesis protein